MSQGVKKQEMNPVGAEKYSDESSYEAVAKGK